MNHQYLTNLLFISITCTIITFEINAQVATNNDLIHSVIEDYILGWQNADIARLSRAFEVNEGRIIWTSDSEDGEVLRSITFGESLERRKVQPTYGKKWEILNLDIVEGRLGVAKVFISTKKGYYIDYLTLQKIDNQWKIVTKMFVYFEDGS